MMDNFEELMIEYLLKGDNYTKFQNDKSCWLNLITFDEYWRQLFALSFDRTECKQYFFYLKPDEKRQNYFKFGIACYLSFVQANFTGPDLPRHVKTYLNGEIFRGGEFEKRLSANRVDINVNTRYPALLVCAQAIFDGCCVNHLINSWWLMRATRTHQEVFDELSPTIFSNADQTYKLLIDTDQFTGLIKAQLDIELAQFFLIYRNFVRVNKHLSAASEILGVQYVLIKNKDSDSQVEVRMRDIPGLQRPKVDDPEVPQSLEQLGTSPAIPPPALPNLEQKLLLVITEQLFVSIPPDELQIRDLQPHLLILINQKNRYSVRVATLLLRCRAENRHKSAMKTCTSDLEHVLVSFYAERPNALHRIKDYFGLIWPPIWKVENLYAYSLINMGQVQKGLDINLKIKSWEDVILCYNLLGHPQKAVQMIKEQYEMNPTNPVRFMCLLGDATRDESYYEKAWELSRRRSHRVQRHWGQYLFKRKDYASCVPHFEKSLSINPYQYNIWLRLGFAALQSENWHVAATAYRRYTSLEPGAYKAWNNLAQAYVKIDNKLSAHYAITEAIKHKTDCWKIWENCLVINCDILRLTDVIAAYNNILDLMEKYLNVDVLNILIYNINNNYKDATGQPSGRLMPKVRSLVGRIVAVYPHEGFVWEIYASLAPVTMLRLQRLQRAFRGYIFELDWDKDAALCQKVLLVCVKLADIVLDDDVDGGAVIVGSVKVNINTALAPMMRRDHAENIDLLEQLLPLYEKILVKIKTSEL